MPHLTMTDPPKSPIPDHSTSLTPPPPAEPSSLPPATSPTLYLTHPTPEEKIGLWILNGINWRGALPLSTYLRREPYLASQPLTVNGGLTYWILVDSASTVTPRPILASCETLHKKALVAHRGGPVEDVISHGVGSVFCREEYRGRGYARRMMEELGKELEHWQQEDGKKAKFTVLWSDIGKVRFCAIPLNPRDTLPALLKASQPHPTARLTDTRLRNSTPD